MSNDTIYLEFPNDFTANAVLKSLGWSISAVEKRLSRGDQAEQARTRSEYLALSDLQADILSQKRRLVGPKCGKRLRTLPTEYAPTHRCTSKTSTVTEFKPLSKSEVSK